MAIRLGNQDQYSYSQGLQLIHEMVEQGHYIFTPEDLKPVSHKFHISDNYLFSSLLTRMERSGWISKLRRGLYATTGTLPGHGDIPVFAIATRLVEPSAISHWSALHHHHFTEQIPHVVTAMTTKKVLTPSMRSGRKEKSWDKHVWRIHDRTYEYMTVGPEHYFGITQVWIDQNFKIPMTDKERTILECFISYRMFGGMGEAFHILSENLPSLDLDKLVGYAIQYNMPTIAKRLGFALEEFGVKAKTLLPLIRLPLSNFAPLDPTRLHRGPCIKRWMLQDNRKAQIKR